MYHTIAIHQPNYLPWLGYFYKIYAAGQFILLDDVPYSKGSVTARTHTRKQPGRADRQYLTVPVRQSPLGTLIRELEIDHTQDWPVQQVNRVEYLYRNALFFEQYFPEFQRWMDQAKRYPRLADWNRFLIESVTGLLGIDHRFVLASELPVSGAGTEYLIRLIGHLGGTRYLSGQGAKKYQDPGLFREAGIALSYHDFYHFMEQYPYAQAGEPRLNGLSVLDALMHIGAEGIVECFSRYRSTLSGE